MSAVEVTDNPSASRFEAHLDGQLAGFAEYRLTDDTIEFVHTEVVDRFEGKGVGSALARAALDDVRARGDLDVVPTCPFIRRWIGKHPDYADLVQVREDRSDERPAGAER